MDKTPGNQIIFKRILFTFNNESMIQNNMQSRTSQHHGFARNVVEAKNLNDAVAKFSWESAADRSDFKKLTDTNAYLQQRVVNISSNND